MEKELLIDLNDLRNRNDEDILRYLEYRVNNKFDNNDIESLKKLIGGLTFDNSREFNVSYSIYRLDKEFDLVKNGDKTVINIELKKTRIDFEQCLDNYRILKRFYNNKKVHVFSYISNSNSVYILDYKNKIMKESSLEELNEYLSKIKIGYVLDIELDVKSVYLNPTIYIEEKYNLSFSQNNTKNKVINSKEKCNIINGTAGCGKTLLALDIYRYYSIEGKKVCYLAPFKYNDIINSTLCDIINIKTIRKFIQDKKMYDIVIVDEGQRMVKGDYANIIKNVKEKLIIFGDENQNIDYEPVFEMLINKDSVNVINMNQVIRTDNTIDVYARKILGYSQRNIKNRRIDKSKIKIRMLSDKNYDLNQYVYIEPSKSLYFGNCTDKCSNHACLNISKKCMGVKNAHKVIGLEYDKVAVFLCSGYSIQNNKIVVNNKVCSGKYDSQLYEIMTRTVKDLLIITDDISIFNYLMDKYNEMK